MAFWLDIAAFLVKALIIVAAIGGLALLSRGSRARGEAKDKEIKVSRSTSATTTCATR